MYEGGYLDRAALEGGCRDGGCSASVMDGWKGRELEGVFWDDGV